MSGTSKLYEVINYTFYNTEDLAALLAAVESELPERGVIPQRALLNRWHEEEGEVGRRVYFKDFTTKKKVITHRTWDMVTSAPISWTERHYVKSASWRGAGSVNEVRIVSPHKLWDGPLEALAAQGEVPLMPEDAKLQLAVRLVTLYRGMCDHNGCSEKGREVANVAVSVCGPIRIMDKRSAVVDTAEKHRVAQHKARKSWQDADHALDKITRYVEVLSRANASAVKTLNRSKVPMTDLQQQVSAAVEAAKAAVLKAQSLLRQIKAEQKPEDLN
jgi:hypothetical protein